MKSLEHCDKPIFTLVNPPAFEGGDIKGRISPDVYTKISIPPVGLASIAAVAREEGCEVDIVDTRFDNGDGNFSEAEWKLMLESHYVGIGAMLRNTTTSLRLIRELLKYNPDQIFPVGGFGPEFEPERWLSGEEGKNIIVVRGDGEETIKELIRAKMNGEGIMGVSYKRKDGTIIHNPDRPLPTGEQLSNWPMPWYPPKIRDGRKTHAVNKKRGCTGRCGFCQVAARYKGNVIEKNDDRGIAEIKDGREGENVFFCDDNFAPRSLRENVKRFLRRIISEGLIRDYSAQIDASFAGDPELIKLSKKAGFIILFQGKESINNDELKKIHKPNTAKQSMDSTEILTGKGFFVFDNFISGLPGQTWESINKLKKYFRKDNKANAGMILLLTPLPGTEFGREKKLFPFVYEDTNVVNGNFQVTDPPEGFACCEQQNLPSELYPILYSKSHLFKTILRDSKQIFSGIKGYKRALKLIALDTFATQYANETVKSMQKDSYTQSYIEKLKKVDEERTKEREREQAAGIAPTGTIFTASNS